MRKSVSGISEHQETSKIHVKHKNLTCEVRTDKSVQRVTVLALRVLHRNSTVARRVTKVTSEHYGDP